MFIIILEYYFSDVILAGRITCFVTSNSYNACCASCDYYLVLCSDISNFVIND